MRITGNTGYNYYLVHTLRPVRGQAPEFPEAASQDRGLWFRGGMVDAINVGDRVLNGVAPSTVRYNFYGAHRTIPPRAGSTPAGT